MPVLFFFFCALADTDLWRLCLKGWALSCHWLTAWQHPSNHRGCVWGRRRGQKRIWGGWRMQAPIQSGHMVFPLEMHDTLERQRQSPCMCEKVVIVLCLKMGASGSMKLNLQRLRLDALEQSGWNDAETHSLNNYQGHLENQHGQWESVSLPN